MNSLTDPRSDNQGLTTKQDVIVPEIVTNAGEDASRHFIEFFIAQIRNRNTRRAYGRQVRIFCLWCQHQGVPHPILDVREVTAAHVSTYIELLTYRSGQKPSSVKQALAAIRMLGDWLVVKQVLRGNPASPVRGPKLVVTEGLTPCLEDDDVVAFFESIEAKSELSLVDLRDRALFGVMAYTFTRVGAACGLDRPDYFQQGKSAMIRRREKGGKVDTIAVHHVLERYMDEYIEAAGIAEGSLFRTAYRRTGRLTENRMTQDAAWDMLQRRARFAGIDTPICNHGVKATGITNYLNNGGDLEHAQRMALHSDPRTTKLYDRRRQQISRTEVERIRYERKG